MKKSHRYPTGFFIFISAPKGKKEISEIPA
jgi:hypothetical protein